MKYPTTSKSTTERNDQRRMTVICFQQSHKDKTKRNVLSEVSVGPNSSLQFVDPTGTKSNLVGTPKANHGKGKPNEIKRQEGREYRSDREHNV